MVYFECFLSLTEIIKQEQNKKSQIIKSDSFKIIPWQLAIFPGGLPPSIVAASSLYDRVRDGNGCFPAAWPPEI